VQRDIFDLRLADGYYRVATAIRAVGAVHLLLHFAGQDLKRLLSVVLGGQVAAKGEVLFRLRGSEPKDFSQIGNHA
jgi:hypothetical protein